MTRDQFLAIRIAMENVWNAPKYWIMIQKGPLDHSCCKLKAHTKSYFHFKSCFSPILTKSKNRPIHKKNCPVHTNSQQKCWLKNRNFILSTKKALQKNVKLQENLFKFTGKKLVWKIAETLDNDIKPIFIAIGTGILTIIYLEA